MRQNDFSESSWIYQATIWKLYGNQELQCCWLINWAELSAWKRKRPKRWTSTGASINWTSKKSTSLMRLQHLKRKWKRSRRPLQKIQSLNVYWVKLRMGGRSRKRNVLNLLNPISSIEMSWQCMVESYSKEIGWLFLEQCEQRSWRSFTLGTLVCKALYEGLETQYFGRASAMTSDRKLETAHIVRCIKLHSLMSR